MSEERVRVAIAQARPAVFDLERGVEQATQLVADAAEARAELVVIGETFIPGYPIWLDHCPEVALWDHEPTKRVYERLHDNAVAVPGPVTEALAAAASDNGVVLVASVMERGGRGPGHGSLYAALLTFDADGTLLNHHRKLVPTYTERLLWGHGDAAGLVAVDTAVGRVGGLICWEHFMPLARQALHDEAEQIHVAVWPSVKEHHLVASRHYAFEGRCFVLAAGQIQRVADLPEELEIRGELGDDPDALTLDGQSAIIGPDGKLLAGPVEAEETLVMADLDLGACRRESMNLDASGHYQRPDIFDFSVRRRRRGPREGA